MERRITESTIGNYEGRCILKSVVEITLSKDEFEKTLGALGFKTYNLRRDHKKKFLQYILERYGYEDLFIDYGIWFSMFNEYVTFTYDAFLKEDHDEEMFKLIQNELKRSRIRD